MFEEKQGSKVFEEKQGTRQRKDNIFPQCFVFLAFLKHLYSRKSRRQNERWEDKVSQCLRLFHKVSAQCLCHNVCVTKCQLNVCGFCFAPFLFLDFGFGVAFADVILAPQHNLLERGQIVHGLPRSTTLRRPSRYWI